MGYHSAITAELLQTLQGDQPNRYLQESHTAAPPMSLGKSTVQQQRWCIDYLVQQHGDTAPLSDTIDSAHHVSSAAPCELR